MSRHVLMPRLRTEEARRLRDRIVAAPDAVAFEEELLETALGDARAFPSTGGVPCDHGSLIWLRDECLTAEAAIDVDDPDRWAVFDMEMGRVLHESSEGRRGEFGHPEVWDFLGLVLLPDLLVRRVVSTQVPSRATFLNRITGGHRRHALQRLWRRWAVFGEEVVTSRVLSEDDYAALLEREVTSHRPVLSRLVARQIADSGFEGQRRRDYTRSFMRRLQASSGFLALSADDEPHLAALVSHVHRETADALRGVGTGSPEVSAAVEAQGRMGTVTPRTEASSAPTARRRPAPLRRLFGTP